MKAYRIMSSGEYVKAIFLKNTAKVEEPTFWKSLVITRKPSDEDFCNCNFFFTGKREEALVFKSNKIALMFAELLSGYIEEFEI